MENTSNNIYEFPKQVDKIVRVVAKEMNLLVFKKTHYDDDNLVLLWYENNIKKRIDLSVLGGSISVTFYCDIYPFNPKVIDWCHDNIPFFPIKRKSNWKNLGELPLTENDEYYYHHIKKYINYAKNRK